MIHHRKSGFCYLPLKSVGVCFVLFCVVGGLFFFFLVDSLITD